MRYKALISFSGLVSMSAGEVGVIADPSVVKDLLKAGYIEEYDPVPVPEKPKGRKKKNEG